MATVTVKNNLEPGDSEVSVANVDEAIVFVAGEAVIDEVLAQDLISNNPNFEIVAPPEGDAQVAAAPEGEAQSSEEQSDAGSDPSVAPEDGSGEGDNVGDASST